MLSLDRSYNSNRQKIKSAKQMSWFCDENISFNGIKWQIKYLEDNIQKAKCKTKYWYKKFNIVRSQYREATENNGAKKIEELQNVKYL